MLGWMLAGRSSVPCFRNGTLASSGASISRVITLKRGLSYNYRKLIYTFGAEFPLYLRELLQKCLLSEWKIENGHTHLRQTQH